MNSDLRILILEDSAGETAPVLVRELRSGGSVPVCERAGTLETMAAALKSGWDVVLAVHNNRACDILAALDLLRTAIRIPP